MINIVKSFIYDFYITLKYLFFFYIGVMLIAFVERSVLLLIHKDVFFSNRLSLGSIFMYGIRSDIIISSYIVAFCAILYLITFKYIKSLVIILLRTYIYLFTLGILIIFSVTFSFFAEYNVKPNYLFVRYLGYPTEVSSMILEGYKVPLVATLLLVAIFTYIYFKLIKKETFTKLLNINHFTRIVIFCILAPLIFLGARSGIGRRGATPSTFIISDKFIINEIIKNSSYTVFYATYSEFKHSASVEPYMYTKMSPKEAINITKKLYSIEGSASSLSRVEKTHFKSNKKRNLIVFLQESLGARFVYSITHNIKVTPNLDRLSKDGIYFTNLNAVGTRSIRGIAATTAGSLPIVGKGVVSVDSTYGTYFTFAKLLAKQGYESSFIYGGEKQFDNMGSYFNSNGYSKIIDQTDYKNPIFVGSWGVSDEDLVTKADKLYSKYHKAGIPFSSLMFSSSNHTPFLFPSGKIELYNKSDKNVVENAVKYADYAIGKFIKKAKEHGYYDNSIIVIIADHNVRTLTNSVFPVTKYHIPALILGAGIKPMIYDKLSSQPDVLATALDLMGKDFKYPIFGNSIFSDKKREISFMNYNSTFALRISDRVVILNQYKKPLYFIYKDGKLVKSRAIPSLGKKILALMITMKYLHQNGLYKAE